MIDPKLEPRRMVRGREAHEIAPKVAHPPNESGMKALQKLVSCLKDKIATAIGMSLPTTHFNRFCILALTENSDSESASRANFEVCDSDIDTEAKRNDKLAKYLSISGIPNKFLTSDDDKREIFRKLCEILEVSVRYEDIDKIYKNGNKLIVRLQRAETRDLIIAKMKDIQIWTKDVCKLRNDDISQKICVGPHVIPGYAK